jgi:hypothetical protein
MKKIKLFENYLGENYEKELVDFLYEKIQEEYLMEDSSIREGEDDYSDEDWENFDDKNLTRGERAALARDNQVISRSQLAALYLKALGRVEGEDGAYLVMIDGIKDFGEFDTNTRAFKITVPALADAIGLESMGTVYRTVNKFVNLIKGVGETQGEVLYPKVVSAYGKFSSMNPVQLSNLAARSIQKAEEYTLNRDKAESMRGSASSTRLEKAKREDLTGEKVYSLINSLKSSSSIFKEPGRAQKMAIKKISTETGDPEEKIKEYYKKYLMSRKIFNSANFYEGR